VNVLVTGICGFVGGTLAKCLLQRIDGLSIWGIDNLMRTGSETNRAILKRLVSRPRILVDTSLEEMMLLQGGEHGETQAS
jgi:nucleoside-diphosphate-sugar epimerase